MSTPENILAKYQTYSYYHTLVVCSSTQAAETLATRNQFADFARDSGTDKFRAREIEGGKYVILINGASDGEFTIQSLKWSSIMAPNINQGGMEYYGTIATEGSMNVLEPRGIRFLNKLNNALNEMAIDFSSAIFVIKTTFVGYDHDGNEDVINTVQPLLFIMYDVTADFSSPGASYDFSFVAVTNGAAKMQQINKASDSIATLTIGKDATLSDAVVAFNQQLNVAYQSHLEKVQEVIGDTIITKPVYYIITLDDIYLSEDYRIDQFPTTSTNKDEGDPTINFGKSTTVESALHLIMKHCKKVVDEDSKGKTPDSKKYTYKITSSIKSDEDSMLVMFHINRYRVPVSLIDRASKRDEQLEVDGNFLQLDYIFSGQNVDILEFDMKMAMGLNFLQTLSTTNSVPAEQNAAPVEDLSASSTAPTTTGDQDNKRKIPIFFSTPIKNPLTRHARDPLSNASFQQQLSRFASLEGLEAKVEITGNPIFLDNMTRLPTDLTSASRRTANTEDVAKHFDTTPTLCKINIFMPTDAASQDLFDRERFWYDGYYYIFGVENIFDEGSFTQSLDMMSLPVDMNVEETSDNTDEAAKANKEQDTQQARVDCEETLRAPGRIEIARQKLIDAGAPEEQLDSLNEATNKAEAHARRGKCQ